MAFEFTDKNFQESALDKGGITVVDFWAEWCGPCKMIGPLVEELAHEYAGKANIGKMDVDNNAETPMKYGVRAIPTIIFLKDGELVDKQVGAVTKQVLKDKIEKLMAVPA
jgi:thioredoxin 1